jgi:hypothetical protein
MGKDKDVNHNPSHGVCYKIRVEGQLDASWAEWLGDMRITHEGDSTVLAGRLADQVALRGLLGQLWDLNLSIIEVTRVEAQ